jgi:hypothetical protein
MSSHGFFPPFFPALVLAGRKNLLRRCWGPSIAYVFEAAESFTFFYKYGWMEDSPFTSRSLFDS